MDFYEYQKLLEQATEIKRLFPDELGETDVDEIIQKLYNDSDKNNEEQK